MSLEYDYLFYYNTLNNYSSNHMQFSTVNCLFSNVTFPIFSVEIVRNFEILSDVVEGLVDVSGMDVVHLTAVELTMSKKHCREIFTFRKRLFIYRERIFLYRK